MPPGHRLPLSHFPGVTQAGRDLLPLFSSVPSVYQFLKTTPSWDLLFKPNLGPFLTQQVFLSAGVNALRQHGVSASRIAVPTG